MIYRAFRRTDTGQWLDVLFTSTEDQYPADAAAQAKDLAAALGVAASKLEAVDGSSDPRTGTLAAIPVPAASEDDKVDGDLRQLRAKALDVFNGNSTFTAAQVQKILAGIVLRLTR